MQPSTWMFKNDYNVWGNPRLKNFASNWMLIAKTGQWQKNMLLMRLSYRNGRMVGTRRVKWGLELNSQGHRLGYTCIVQSLSFQVKKLGTDKTCSLWQEDLGIYEEVYLKLGETGGRERHKRKKGQVCTGNLMSWKHIPLVAKFLTWRQFSSNVEWIKEKLNEKARVFWDQIIPEMHNV